MPKWMPFIIFETGDRTLRIWLYWNFHKPEGQRRRLRLFQWIGRPGKYA